MPKSKSQSKEESSSFIAREIIAAILFTFGIFSSLSLLFYSSKSGLDIKGSMGTIGVFISGMLGKTFGICSFVIPLVMFYTAVVVFTNKTGSRLYQKAISAFIFLFAATTFLGLIFKSKDILGYSPPGGWLGDLLSTLLRDKIAGTFGSYIIVTIILLISLIIMMNLSLSQTLYGLGSLGKVLTFGAELITSALRFMLRQLEVIIENLYDFFSRPKPKISKVPTQKKVKPVKQAVEEEPPPKLESTTLPPIIIEQQKEKPGDKIVLRSIEHANFKPPPTDLLDPKKEIEIKIDKDTVYEKAKLIEEKLADFGVSGKVTEIRPGPVITMFEYKPSPGIKINKIASLSGDLAMGLSALSIRIIAPIPGKDVVGIEVPNDRRETVVLRELLEDQEFVKSKSILTLALGKDISGKPFYMDLRKAPHLMIAGTTGSGKSVLLHTVMASMLYKASPYVLKFIMIDPKMLELSVYEDIPHLLHPVVINPKESAAALRWAVREMEQRYRLLSEEGVRDIESYNRRIEKLDSKDKWEKWLPYIVIVMDELADLMMVAPREVEESITRLSQMARAAGIHLIVATQRPSVDIVAGLIKANFPARISFLVSSRIDSRIILDNTGAEQLLGKGDMLLLQPGTSKLIRIQGALISDGERDRIAEYLKSQGLPEYNKDITKLEETEAPQDLESEKDDLYYEALRIIAETRQASISMLQRKLKIGYNRAARIVEIMEKEGVVGPQEIAGKPREVYIDLAKVSQRQRN
ncbi:MAG: DNA translocase FtsK 4TM domain-containing protein [Candidatus Dadabacteria bacterium]|nr:DNA translocase FtsK 4TM domain-containing protein [Candidatus Dadabacteria bacterium]